MLILLSIYLWCEYIDFSDLQLTPVGLFILSDYLSVPPMLKSELLYNSLWILYDVLIIAVLIVFMLDELKCEGTSH